MCYFRYWLAYSDTGWSILGTWVATVEWVTLLRRSYLISSSIWLVEYLCKLAEKRYKKGLKYIYWSHFEFFKTPSRGSSKHGFNFFLKNWVWNIHICTINPKVHYICCQHGKKYLSHRMGMYQPTPVQSHWFFLIPISFKCLNKHFSIVRCFYNDSEPISCHLAHLVGFLLTTRSNDCYREVSNASHYGSQFLKWQRWAIERLLHVETPRIASNQCSH
jgi:hypothetical protein